MDKRHIVLLQPRYPHGKPQICLPGSLLNLGARLMKAGFSVDLMDLNLVDLEEGSAQKRLSRACTIGISVVGTPYIPVVRNLIVDLRRQGHLQQILVGGEGILRLTAEQFYTIFQNLGDVWQIRSEYGEDLAMALEMKSERIPGMLETSMVPFLRTFDNETLESYLTREFCLLVSRGCAYNCHFCAAAKNQPEQYRKIDVLLEEVSFIARFLQRIGQQEMCVSVSNLDALQNWRQFDEALARMHAIVTDSGVHLKIRALATTHFTALALRRDSQILARLRSHGLLLLGFGVDGVSEDVWRRQNKRQNSMSDLEECVDACKKAGIQPEALMVLGLPDETSAETLAAIIWSLHQAYTKDVVIRVYLGKGGSPGSKRWQEDQAHVQRFLKDPQAFLNMDYTMFASPMTHPDIRERLRANFAYATLLALLLPTRSVTPPLLPIPTNAIALRFVKWINKHMPIDR